MKQKEIQKLINKMEKADGLYEKVRELYADVQLSLKEAIEKLDE